MRPCVRQVRAGTLNRTYSLRNRTLETAHRVCATPGTAGFSNFQAWVRSSPCQAGQAPAPYFDRQPRLEALALATTKLVYATRSSYEYKIRLLRQRESLARESLVRSPGLCAWLETAGRDEG